MKPRPIVGEEAGDGVKMTRTRTGVEGLSAIAAGCKIPVAAEGPIVDELVLDGPAVVTGGPVEVVDGPT